MQTTDMTHGTAPEIIMTPPAQMTSGQIKSLTTDEILAELNALVGDTLAKLQRIVPLWQELESRGVDLSSLRKGICFYVPLIIQGKVDPAMVARFASNGALLRQATLLPIAEQRRLAGGQKVKVLVVSRREQRPAEKDPVDLSGAQVRQVFSPEGIRSIEEQRERFEARHQPVQAAVQFNPELRTLRVDKSEVPLSKITAAIVKQSRAVEGSPHEAQVRKTTPVHIPDKLHRALRARATEMDLSPDQLLIKILWGAGIVES